MRKILKFNHYQYEFSYAGLRDVINDSLLDTETKRKLSFKLLLTPPSILTKPQIIIMGILLIILFLTPQITDSGLENWIFITFVVINLIFGKKVRAKFKEESPFEKYIKQLDEQYNLKVHIEESL